MQSILMNWRELWNTFENLKSSQQTRSGGFSRVRIPTWAPLRYAYLVVPHSAIVRFITLCRLMPYTNHFAVLLRLDHFGVAKAFLEADLLPRVITGTSAGGLVAALLCTRTDEELKEMLIPELACKITACEEPFSVWSKRVWKTGARFDSTIWARKVCALLSNCVQFKADGKIGIVRLVYTGLYDL
jgi:hypothetical protein